MVENSVKKEIEREFPDLFTTVSVGKWYKMDDEEFPLTYIFVTSTENNEVKGYGFMKGMWYNDTKINSYFTWADDPDLKLVLQNELYTEVKDLFEKEVIRRYGENWGIRKIKTDALGREINNSSLCVPFITEHLIWNENGPLYYEGNWAEVFPEEDYKTLKKENAEVLLSDLLGENIIID